MSDFAAPVVKIKSIQKHPNADSLSITEVEGCPVLFKTIDLNVGDLAVYVPIDSLVPLNHPVFKFLRPDAAPGKRERIKAKRLRGVFSMGLLIPLSEFEFNFKVKEGKDLAKELDIIKYEEPEDLNVPVKLNIWQKFTLWIKYLFKPKPIRYSRNWPVYDVEHYRKYKNAIQDGEDVIITEKIHGQNFNAVYHKEQIKVSSHKVVKGIEDDSNWWRVANKYDLKNKLIKFPDLVLYGEVYGDGVQDMKYDKRSGEIELAIFDIYELKSKTWLHHADMVDIAKQLEIPTVPILYQGLFNRTEFEAMADGKSTLAGHYREGVVVRPVRERRERFGRVVLKLIGESYLLRKNGTERH